MELITLSNLGEKSGQEVFDFVVDHLLNQNERSRIETVCAYRGINKDGKLLKCAAGCLISDEEYNEKLEYNNWPTLINKGLVPDHHSKLIKDLQEVHDCRLSENWTYFLKEISKKYKLTWNR